MKEQWESSKTGLQERQAEEAFRFQISSLVKKERFGLEDFVQSIRDVARESGLDKGWKTMVPGVKNHPMMVELRMQETIWEKIPPPLRENASRIKAAEKAKIARDAGTTVEQINKFLKRYEEMRTLHTWVRRRAMDGKTLPQNLDEMQRLAAEPDSGFPRKVKTKP